MNIHQVLDDKIRKASKGDRTRVNRVLIYLKTDCEILGKNYNHRLYTLYRDFYIKKLDSEKGNYKDPTIVTYLANKCVTRLREVKKNQKLK